VIRHRKEEEERVRMRVGGDQIQGGRERRRG